MTETRRPSAGAHIQHATYGRPAVQSRALSGRPVFRGLCRVIPPSVGNTAKIARLRRRSAEYVPVGDPVRGLIPVWNPVAAGANDAVERTAGRHQRGA